MNINNTESEQLLAFAENLKNKITVGVGLAWYMLFDYCFTLAVYSLLPIMSLKRLPITINST